MRIECPHCKASGNMNELDIPDEGIYLACPRCSESFHVQKPRKKITSPYATNTCPSCGYSTYCEEVFDDCPKCGISVKVMRERKRADESRRREQELLNRSFRDTAPPSPPPVIPLSATGSKYIKSASQEERPRITLASFANGFDPVAAVGWGAALFSAVILFWGIMGLMDYHGTDIRGQLSEKSVEPVTEWEVFWGYGFLPWLKTVFGGAFLVTSFGFLQREEWGKKGMEYMVVCLFVLAPLYELGIYTVWIVKSISPPWWAYLVELISAMLFIALWVVPLYFIRIYIKSDSLIKSYENRP